jgi:hypothetical protein
MATLSLSNSWVSDSAWKYYAEKYNSMTKHAYGIAGNNI